MKNLAKKIKTSEIFSDAQMKIADEIVSYFRKEISSQDWAEFIKEVCSIHTIKKKRQTSWCVGFVSPRSGCPETSFWAPGIYWENPENPKGYGSQYYKGIYLYNIQKEVGAQILTLVVNEFHKLGYRVRYRSDDSLFENYTKKVTISW